MLPMSGFEPQTSGIGSNHSTNWTTTIALTVCDPAEQTVLDIRWTEQKIASIFVVVLNERKRERERERGLKSNRKLGEEQQQHDDLMKRMKPVSTKFIATRVLHFNKASHTMLEEFMTLRRSYVEILAWIYATLLSGILIGWKNEQPTRMLKIEPGVNLH